MENINYSKFSEEKKIETPEVKVPETVTTDGPGITVTAPPPAEEATSGYVELVEEPTILIGKVSDCKKLNVREEASKNAAVAKVIDCGETVLIVEEESTDDFYAVQVDDVEGFCMKEFITIE